MNNSNNSGPRNGITRQDIYGKGLLLSSGKNHGQKTSSRGIRNESNYSDHTRKKVNEQYLPHNIATILKNLSVFGVEIFDKVEKFTNNNGVLDMLSFSSSQYNLSINARAETKTTGELCFEFSKDDFPQKIPSRELNCISDVLSEQGIYSIHIDDIGKLVEWCREKMGKDNISQTHDDMGDKLRQIIE